MNGLPYYKAYPRDFIEGTVGMEFEVKAAYRLVLDLVYMHGGALPDDPRYIAGQLGCSVKKWNGIRGALVQAEKLEVRGSCLGNYRADKELENLGKFRDKQRENRLRPNKNKAQESPRSNHTEPDTESDTIAKAIVAPQPSDPLESKSTGRVRGAARGKRMDPNWSPTPKDYAFASSHNLTREEINREADRFRNYWIAASGRNAIKLDWHRTWQNWLTGDYGIVTKRASASNASRNGSRTEAFDRLADRLQGGSDRADAWQHDDPATEGGYVIDASPTRITG